MDDILIHGTDNADHDTKLTAALRKIKDSGLKLNKEKCLFRQRELQFLGHTIGTDGGKARSSKDQSYLRVQTPY